MPHRILEPLILAPSITAFTASAVSAQGDWVSVLIGPASGLAVSLLVLWFLKGYYDRSLSREQENRRDIREMLEKVIDLAAKQHEQSERASSIIAENNALLKSVAQIITKCHEIKSPAPPSSPPSHP